MKLKTLKIALCTATLAVPTFASDTGWGVNGPNSIVAQVIAVVVAAVGG